MSHSAWSEQSDETLAARAKARSVPAFVELVRRYEARVYNFVLRRVRLIADAEDVTQETFLNAWRNIDRYTSRHRFSTWLFTIVSRLTVDHLRQRAAAQRKLSTYVNGRSASSEAAEEISAARECGGRLWSLAAEILNDEQHAAVWLLYAEDLSVKEIACVLGRTGISVRVMLHRARAALAAAAATDVQMGEAPRAVIDARGVEIEGGVACTVA